MKCRDDFQDRVGEIIEVFRESFTASEGKDEGDLIERLARDLMTTTPEKDLHVFYCEDAGKIVGAIIFSRLFFDKDSRLVFVLAPVAVATAKQSQGIGQTLLRHGLSALKANGVDIAITYGDPDYYSKVGFAPITEAVAAAPFKLEFPHGWLGQSLTSQPLTALKGGSRCVPAIHDPVFW